MITCDVMCSSLAGIYLAFPSMNNVHSQDTFWFPHSGQLPSFDFLLSPIPTTERGCCVALVKSICLITQQNVTPIQKTCNHCPRHTETTKGFDPLKGLAVIAYF